jgi:hypothetical protein
MAITREERPKGKNYSSLYLVSIGEMLSESFLPPKKVSSLEIVTREKISS